MFCISGDVDLHPVGEVGHGGLGRVHTQHDAEQHPKGSASPDSKVNNSLVLNPLVLNLIIREDEQEIYF